MKIGPERWHWYTIDSIGVPSSGVYAGASRFARLIAKHDWQLAWNDFWGYFVMYQVVGTKVIPHFKFYNWSEQKPIRLRDEWVAIFEYLKRNHMDAKTIELALEDLKRERKQRLVKEHYEEMAPLRKDVGRMTMEQLGLRSKKLTVFGGLDRALVS